MQSSPGDNPFFSFLAAFNISSSEGGSVVMSRSIREVLRTEIGSSWCGLLKILSKCLTHISYFPLDPVLSTPFSSFAEPSLAFLFLRIIWSCKPTYYLHSLQLHQLLRPSPRWSGVYLHSHSSWEICRSVCKSRFLRSSLCHGTRGVVAWRFSFLLSDSGCGLIPTGP